MAFDKIYKYSAYISMLSQVKDTTHGIHFNVVWTPKSYHLTITSVSCSWPYRVALKKWHTNIIFIKLWCLSLNECWIFPPIFLQIKPAICRFCGAWTKTLMKYCDWHMSLLQFALFVKVSFWSLSTISCVTILYTYKLCKNMSKIL